MGHVKIAFLGTGKLNQALLRGMRLARVKAVIAASVRSPESLRSLRLKFPEIEATTDNEKLVRASKFIFLGVKPHAALELVSSLRDTIPEDAVLISLCARLPLTKIRSALGARRTQIVRLMPNTATETGNGLLGYSTEAKTPLNHELHSLFASLGAVHAIDETQMDAFTILGACAPAFFLDMAQSLGSVATREGLDESFVRQALAQVLIGAGHLIQGGIGPAERIRQIATPGGVTAEGLRALADGGLASSSIQAFDRALSKCRSLTL